MVMCRIKTNMGVIIEYTMKEGHKPTKEIIKSCDTGREGFQEVLVEISKVVNPKAPFIPWVVWVMTRFYKRTITDKSISYDFYLFPDSKKSMGNK